MTYEEFLSQKKISDVPTGLSGNFELNENMFQFQKDIVKWALKRGRCAIFADCGMGKTLMQLEWASHIQGNVLIVAPLAVSEQTIREAQKFGIKSIAYSGDGNPSGEHITITNYERLEKFSPDEFNGIVLDESSIIKSYTGKYRNVLVDSWTIVPFRLCCTATPAPNDFMELGNHAEFLGIMKRTEMLSMFFVHDGGDTSKWRLKGHAKSEFWKWVCDWAVMVRKPSDLGYDDGKFILPKLNIIPSVVMTESMTNNMLFDFDASTLQERQSVRRNSTLDRVRRVAELVAKNPDEQWLLWCDMNVESETLHKLIPNSIEVKGSDTDEHKKKSLIDFSNGDLKVLITKPKIAGMGMNFQKCHNMVFTGLSDSYEQFYQAVRRCWRFGQENEVNCYVVTADTEGAVVENIKRKENQSKVMIDNMVQNMCDINRMDIVGTKRNITHYVPTINMIKPNF